MAASISTLPARLCQRCGRSFIPKFASRTTRCSRGCRKRAEFRFPVSGGPICEILLTKGMVAIIDAADLPLVVEYAWHATVHDRTRYAASSQLRRVTGEVVYMHRLIVGAGPEDDVDHRDHNGLNNRRENIRLCTNAQNRRNMQKTRGVSRYKGVSPSSPKRNAKGTRPWSATIHHEDQQIHLGAYQTEAEAARAYNAAAVRFYAEFAHLNVIEGLSREESIIPPARNRKPGRPHSHQLT